ncbi:MAG: DDE-type integrase/transposase/recombinase [Candidatus Thorarchaeota archaeon]|nr:DDE-type integrase/transposase/recombinase [Candidatus Thorarchaeota archaeon]
MTLREKIVQLALKRSVSEAAVIYSVARSTIYRWLQAYSAHGRTGLVPRSTAPLRPRTVLQQHLIRKILALRRRYHYGPVRLAAVLARRQGVSLSHMTVYRLLKREGLIRAQRQRRRRRYRAWSRERPNELWQLDFKGPYWRGGRRVWRLDVIDDASRYLLASVECERASSKMLLETMRRLVTKYGRPLQVLTDNGAVFASVRGGLSAFQQWCITMGIQHIRARRCHPQTLGKVERVHRTIDEERERLGLCLEEYLEYYNKERPHTSLLNRVPGELYWSVRRIQR